jgi:hypothetical protein
MTLLVCNPYTGSFVLDIGDRIELHPATDAWMSGDRYGEVRKFGKKYVHVLMDRSNRTHRVTPDNIARKV